MTSSAIDDAFAQEGASIDLPGGADLVRAGEQIKVLYRLASGRLAEMTPTSDGGGHLKKVLRPGALIGGAELLGDGMSRRTVTALRDSELEAMAAGRAEALLREKPEFLAEVARTVVEEIGAGASNERRKSLILALIAVSPGPPVRAFAERLAAAMRYLGAEVAVLGDEATGADPSQLHALELENDFVVIGCDRGQGDAIAWALRQADRLVMIGAGEPMGRPPEIPAAIRSQRLIDVVVVERLAAPHGGAGRWLDALSPARIFRIREGDLADEARLARVYTGNSIGLALSGGGARAYAHIGVVRALHELGVAADFLAGTSMGAIIAAGVAMGWTDVELEARIREAFVKSSPLSDIAFPILVMTRGRIVDARLKAHFGDVEIGDLWRPFLCVSTDLTTGAMHVHRRGLLRRALRASLSLPGILPPTVEDGHVLVDGALVRNLPVDLVREQHDGVTIGVDVASAEGLEPDDLLLNPSGWRWLTSGAWLKGPPIVSILIRSATLPSVSAGAKAQDDLVAIVPDVEGVGLQDWKAYDKAVEAGYRAAMMQADQLKLLVR